MRGLNVRFVAALAICALLPVITVVAKDSVSRPFKISGHFQQVIDLYTGDTTTEAKGQATHLGLSTLLGSGNQSLFSGTIVAANRDIIFYDFNSPVFTLTGGTGRFENVSGEFSAVAYNVVVWEIGTWRIITGDFTGSGTITY